MITRVAFGLLLPLVGAIVGILAVLVAMILLFAVHPALGLIPLIPVAAVVWFVVHRERQKHDDEVARIRDR